MKEWKKKWNEEFTERFGREPKTYFELLYLRLLLREEELSREPEAFVVDNVYSEEGYQMEVNKHRDWYYGEYLPNKSYWIANQPPYLLF